MHRHWTAGGSAKQGRTYAPAYAKFTDDCPTTMATGDSLDVTLCRSEAMGSGADTLEIMASPTIVSRRVTGVGGVAAVALMLFGTR